MLEEKERDLRLKSLEHISQLEHTGPPLKYPNSLKHSSSTGGSTSHLHHLHHLDDHKEHEHWVHDRLIDWPEGFGSVFLHIISLPVKASL